MPAGKELHWFAAPELAAHSAGPGDVQRILRIVRTEDAYDRAFAGAEGRRAVGEVSTSYLAWHDGAADRIHVRLGPETKIVAALRRAGDRSYSQWLHLVREGSETLDFADVLDAETRRTAGGWADMWRYEATSRYVEAIAHYQERFGADRAHVVLFDELQADVDDTIRSLFRFLEVDADAEVPPVHSNRGGLPRSKTLAWLVFASRRSSGPPGSSCRPGPAAGPRSGPAGRRPAPRRPSPPSPARRRVDEATAGDVAHLERLIGRPTGWLRPPSTGSAPRNWQPSASEMVRSAAS